MTCLVANTVFVVRYVGNKWDLNKVLSKKRDKYDEYQKSKNTLSIQDRDEESGHHFRLDTYLGGVDKSYVFIFLPV